ncbi:MAG: flagellar motor protein MotB [Demequinaceae bacterium]|nr:flagellar motor protein MotB [Demequinaceae bacterium]
MSHAPAGNGRARKHEEEEHENHERWAVSYADMMTVLCALFIVLYAISVVDQTKFEQLRTSLAIGFGSPAVSMLEGSSGPLNGVESFQIAPDFTGVSGDSKPASSADSIEMSQEAQDFLAATQEYEQLGDIEKQIQAQLDAQGLSASVDYKIDERGLVVGLVGSDVFFAPDDAALTGAAQLVVDTIAAPLRNQARQISIEGHANVLPSQHYATNWELSSDRATKVLRRFVEAGGLPGGQISAIGYGDARPEVSGTSPEALAANRRVDIVIQSAQSEAVRALLPKLAQALADGTLTQEGLLAQIEAANATKAAATVATQGSES